MMYYFFPLSLSLFSPLRSVCSVVSLVRLWRLFGRTFLYLAQYHYQRAIIHVFDYTSLFHFSVDSALCITAWSSILHRPFLVAIYFRIP
jgi:hypothetical protein